MISIRCIARDEMDAMSMLCMYVCVFRRQVNRSSLFGRFARISSLSLSSLASNIHIRFLCYRFRLELATRCVLRLVLAICVVLFVFFLSLALVVFFPIRDAHWVFIYMKILTMRSRNECSSKGSGGRCCFERPCIGFG